MRPNTAQKRAPSGSPAVLSPQSGSTAGERFAKNLHAQTVSPSSLSHLGAIFWPSWGHLGAIMGPSWGYLGPPWAILGASWAILGPAWGHLGPSWGHLGAILGPSWAILGHLGAILAPSWARKVPGRGWIHFGRHFGPILESFRVHFCASKIHFLCIFRGRFLDQFWSTF